LALDHASLDCYADGSVKNEIRLSFSFATDDQIVDGIRILSGVVRSELLKLE